MRTTNSGSECQSDIWFISCVKEQMIQHFSLKQFIYAFMRAETSRDHVTSSENTVFQLCLQVVLNVASLTGSLSTTVSNSFRSVISENYKTKYRQNSASTIG